MTMEEGNIKKKIESTWLINPSNDEVKKKRIKIKSIKFSKLVTLGARKKLLYRRQKINLEQNS